MHDLGIKQLNQEVYLSTDSIVRLDKRAIEFIKNAATISTRGRARICAHKQSSDNLHEMIIAIQKNNYIRPHRHHNKIESFHLIEGRADVVIFDDAGSILDVIKLGEQHNFYYRLDASHYHTLLVYSPLLVIHEVTNGPFDSKETDFASFSPHENEADNILNYIKNLNVEIQHKYK